MSAPAPKGISRPPGPRGRFLLGSLPDFARDVLGFFERCMAEHGDVVRVRLAGSEVLLLNRPKDIETILLTNRSNFIKHTFFFRHVTATFGTGLLTGEGDFWLRQRRLAAPAFHPNRIASYGAVMADRANRLTDSWNNGEARDLHPDMMRATMAPTPVTAEICFRCSSPRGTTKAMRWSKKRCGCIHRPT